MMTPLSLRSLSDINVLAPKCWTDGQSVCARVNLQPPPTHPLKFKHTKIDSHQGQCFLFVCDLDRDLTGAIIVLQRW